MQRAKAISIIGSGYVGTTTAAVLANCNHNVTVVDIDSEKVKNINHGTAPFFEKGLDDLISEAVKQKRLKAVSSYDSISDADIVFSCVGTPDNPDGSSNLQYVFAAAEEAAKFMQPGAIFVQKSTVPVGTGAKLEDMFSKKCPGVAYVSNPEFLREGTAISDTLWFDRIVAGGTNNEPVQKVLDLYRAMDKCRDSIAETAGITPPSYTSGAFISTNRNSAELIKVTANAFLALKISFANSIAKLADQTDADVTEVMDAVGADRRIGRAFLNAGRGYGGGCFPKDVSGLISSATEHGVDLPIMNAAAEVNDSMPGYIANKALDAMGGDFHGKRVAVLGLAFKAGTSDARRSPGVRLANILSHDGAAVNVYDPKANHEAKEDLRKSIIICSSQEEAVKGVDAVFITTDWPEFTALHLKKLKNQIKGNLFIDAVNCYNAKEVGKCGFKYIGVGIS